jgi:hypothetical protein
VKIMDLLHKKSEEKVNQAAMDRQLNVKMNEKIIHLRPQGIETGEKIILHNI